MKKIIVLLLTVALFTAFVSCTKQPTENIPENDGQLTDNTENVPSEEEVPEENTSEVPEEIPEEVVETPKEVTVTLYFPDNDALYLHPEERVITPEGDSENEKVNLVTAILDELFKGPATEGLSPSLIGEELVNSVEVSDDGTCTIDFKSDFAFLNAGGTARENFVFGSIVNSVCTVEGIERVKFNIDGNANAEFGGHFTLEAPISPRLDLVK